MVFVVLAAGIGIVLTDDDESHGSGEPGAAAADGAADHDETSSTTAATTSSTTVAPAAPAPPLPGGLSVDQSFAAAAARLREAGSFAYSGTIEIDGPGPLRPTGWFGRSVAAEGEVALPDRTHDITLNEHGDLIETITVGTEVWTRTAETRDQLAVQLLAPSARGQGTMGAALLPGWLSATSQGSYERTDAQGRPTLHATVDVGNGTGTGTGEVWLTLATNGDPARIEITAPPLGNLHLTWDISAIGDPVDIATPPRG